VGLNVRPFIHWSPLHRSKPSTIDQQPQAKTVTGLRYHHSFSSQALDMSYLVEWLDFWIESVCEGHFTNSADYFTRIYSEPLS